jgi:hypothetical protein
MALSCSAFAEKCALFVFFVDDILGRCRMSETVREGPIVGSIHGALMNEAQAFQKKAAIDRLK